MKKTIFLSILAAAAAVTTTLTTAYAYDGAQYQKDAKLSMDQARAQALKLAPGTIKDAELEKEAGGSGLRYSFDIRTGGALHEVGIDAVTGKVLENSAESRTAEATEARSEDESVEHENNDTGGASTIHETEETED